jgi:hypothetical protein
VLVSFLSSLLYRPTRSDSMRHAPDGEPSSEAVNRRDYYRIHFPVEERPRMLLDSQGAVRLVCEVLECSERGLRFLSPTRWLRGSGAAVSGTIVFGGGTEVHVSGSVIRVQGDEVAVLLGREGIPLAVVLEEQRRLRGRYAHSD